MTRARGVALAVLVLLSGCSTGGVAGDRTEATATLTPAPVPEAATRTPAPGRDRVAPGLTGDEVVSISDLLTGHTGALSRTSYTVRRTVTRRFPNGTLRSGYESEVRLSADKRRFHYVLDQTSRASGTLREVHIERWSDGRRVFEARTRENRTTYTVFRLSGRGRGREVFPENGTNVRGLRRLLGLLDITVTGREVRNGTTLYRVETPHPQPVPPLSDVSIAALVDRSGVIREYRLSYLTDRRRSRLRVSVRVVFTRLGETPVQRPDWYGDAVAATNVTTTTST